MRRLLAAVLLVTSAFAGCLDGSVLEGLREDLEAEDEFEQRSLLDVEVPFSPAGIVDPDRSYEDERDASTQWNDTFAVPNGTRSMTVIFEIDFNGSEQQDDLPGNPPDGEVRVYLTSPDGEVDRNLTRNEPAQAGFDFTGPKAGDWTIGMDARGNGTVSFDVDATVPIQAS
jgi:hypothetical protein